MTYFFDLYQKATLTRDCEGVNLSSFDDAVTLAIEGVREIVAEQARSGELSLDAFVDIRLGLKPNQRVEVERLS